MTDRLPHEKGFHISWDQIHRDSRALAWRLGVPGFDDSWADPLPDELVRPRPREQMVTDLDWAVHHLAPWVGRSLRGFPRAPGLQAKRPVPTVVPRSPVAARSQPAER